MPLVLDEYEDDDWDELPAEIQKLCEGIGYTQKLWDKDKDPECFDKDWEELTPTEQDAAAKLGYTPETWDEEE